MTDTEKADLSALRIQRTAETSNPKKWKWVLFVLPVVAIGAFLYVANPFSGAVEVELASATLSFPSQTNAMLTASGYVVAQRKASVASKGTGRLEYLGVEEGDRVKQGQIIARLEDADVIAALERSKADVELAKADLVDAERSRDRLKTLLGSGLASKAEFDAAEARYLRVGAAIKSAEAAVRSAEVAVENTRIRAPFDGTVLTKDADVGEVVAPFASSSSSRGAVVTMADMSSLEVEADVSESNIMRVQVNQPCEIILDAYPDKRYPGTVNKIVPTADRAKATVLTKVKFKNRDERVLPEMSAKVTFLSKELDEAAQNAPPALTIPSNAMITRDGKRFVFVLRGEEVELITIAIGERVGNRVEIREGLQNGDKVVVNPDPDLVSGTKVKLPS